MHKSWEESAEQVKLRAERLGISAEKILIFPETNVEAVIQAIGKGWITLEELA